MAISVTDQAMAFLGALALGGALGVLYDLFRLVRVRLKLRALGALLDLGYWALAVLALFGYCLAAGNGDGGRALFPDPEPPFPPPGRQIVGYFRFFRQAVPETLDFVKEFR